LDIISTCDIRKTGGCERLALRVGPGGVLSELAAVGGTAVQNAVLLVVLGDLGGCLTAISSANNSHLRTGADKGNPTV
jgi:hypothetical protein